MRDSTLPLSHTGRARYSLCQFLNSECILVPIKIDNKTMNGIVIREAGSAINSPTSNDNERTTLLAMLAILSIREDT